mmetsp:Transcript_16063/g.2658  ORF Transcript_16063/g.2658 Transcript_16063/m.2658 type:complete len:89 (-) Transcript_16063:89-355(-)
MMRIRKVPLRLKMKDLKGAAKGKMKDFEDTLSEEPRKTDSWFRRTFDPRYMNNSGFATLVGIGMLFYIPFQFYIFPKYKPERYAKKEV